MIWEEDICLWYLGKELGRKRLRELHEKEKLLELLEENYQPDCNCLDGKNKDCDTYVNEEMIMSHQKKQPDYVLKEMEKRMKEIGVPPGELELRMEEAEHFADYARHSIETRYTPKEFRKYARATIKTMLEQYGVKEENNG